MFKSFEFNIITIHVYTMYVLRFIIITYATIVVTKLTTYLAIINVLTSNITLIRHSPMTHSSHH